MQQSRHAKEALQREILLNMVGNSANFGKRCSTKYIFVHVFPEGEKVFFRFFVLLKISFDLVFVFCFFF
jgi:hypothetical protein